jgi:hypothetical protein
MSPHTKKQPYYSAMTVEINCYSIVISSVGVHAIQYVDNIIISRKKISDSGEEKGNPQPRGIGKETYVQ